MLQSISANSAFSVNDLDKAAAFYKDILGLKVDVIEKEHYKLLYIYIDANTKVQVYEKPDHQPATFTIIYFIVPNAEKAVDNLTAKGVKFEHYDTEGLKTNEKGINTGYGTPPKAWFKDPAGNFLCIIEDEK